MGSLGRIPQTVLKDGKEGERIFRLLVTGAASAFVTSSTLCYDNNKMVLFPSSDQSPPDQQQSPAINHTSSVVPMTSCRKWMMVAQCEQISTTTSSSSSSSTANNTNNNNNDDNSPLILPSTRPSWIRRSLAYMRIASLPIPRLLVRGDPTFRMDPRLLQKRQMDEIEMQNLVRGAIVLQDQQQQQERYPKTLQDLNDKCLELAYGEGMTMKKRQDFVHRHGCTAWTEEVLETIIELGRERGVVEIGAGNGQWTRALMDRYEEKTAAAGHHQRKKKKKFDFVLAYDDQSELPLDQQIFNKKTKIHHDFFYDKVQRCGKDFNNILRRFECRGRVLLLVYPPPGPMAIDAVQQYTSASNRNDTVIFVGEGRGGANANDGLFDQFENGEWVLLKVMDVVPLGSKGYEKLYILKRTVFKEE